MKRLGSFAISIFVGTLVLGLGLLPAWGQGGNPPASTKESGQTSGHGYTAVEQTPQKNVEQQIRALHDQGRRAALKGDASFFEAHMATSYFGIGGDGRLRTKAESIQSSFFAVKLDISKEKLAVMQSRWKEEDFKAVLASRGSKR